MQIDWLFLTLGILFILFDCLLFSFLYSSLSEVNIEKNHQPVAIDDETTPSRTWSKGSWIVWSIMLLVCIPGTILFLALGLGCKIEEILHFIARYM